MCTALHFTERLQAAMLAVPSVPERLRPLHHFLRYSLDYSSVAALDVCLWAERGGPLAECGSLDREDVGVVRELLEDAR